MKLYRFFEKQKYLRGFLRSFYKENAGALIFMSVRTGSSASLGEIMARVQQ